MRRALEAAILVEMYLSIESRCSLCYTRAQADGNTGSGYLVGRRWNADVYSVAPLPDEYRIAISLFWRLRRFRLVLGPCPHVFAAGHV